MVALYLPKYRNIKGAIRRRNGEIGGRPEAERKTSEWATNARNLLMERTHGWVTKGMRETKVEKSEDRRVEGATKKKNKRKKTKAK